MIKLVQLSPDDWEKYKTIRLEALKTNPEAFTSTYEDGLKKPESDWRERLEQAAAGKTLLVFAQDEESQRIVGMAGAHYFGEDGKKLSDPMLTGIFVSEDFRKQGIAQQMINYLTDKLRGMKEFANAELHVYCHNKNAIKMYEKLGFVAAPIQPNPEMVSMHLGLGGGKAAKTVKKQPNYLLIGAVVILLVIAAIISAIVISRNSSTTTPATQNNPESSPVQTPESLPLEEQLGFDPSLLEDGYYGPEEETPELPDAINANTPGTIYHVLFDERIPTTNLKVSGIDYVNKQMWYGATQSLARSRELFLEKYFLIGDKIIGEVVSYEWSGVRIKVYTVPVAFDGLMGHNIGLKVNDIVPGTAIVVKDISEANGVTVVNENGREFIVKQFEDFYTGANRTVAELLEVLVVNGESQARVFLHDTPMMRYDLAPTSSYPNFGDIGEYKVGDTLFKTDLKMMGYNQNGEIMLEYPDGSVQKFMPYSMITIDGLIRGVYIQNIQQRNAAAIKVVNW